MIKAFLSKVGLLSKKNKLKEKITAPYLIPRDQHAISRRDISDNALKVLNRLNRHGFEAYLVGGGVRDLLLGLHPKDFDIVTNAKPEEIRNVFRNCRLIGRRFRLAHIYFGHDIIEVATFRGKALASSEDLSHSDEGMILRDNVYGTLKEDVWRRDFTVNALYYNIADFSIVDYTGGFADLKSKQLKMIGEVSQRYREDPVRMLRAIRFASKMNFTLSSELVGPMIELKELIKHISPARLFEEVIKMFHSGAAYPIYNTLKEYDLFSQLFPLSAESVQEANYPTDALLAAVFQNTDRRIQEGKPVTPTFIIAALLWYPVCSLAQSYIDDGMGFFPARLKAMENVFRCQMKYLSIPKRITQGARDIWLLQMRLHKRQGKKIQELMANPRFRAAYDFLEIRAQIGEPVKELVQWWQAYMQGDGSTQERMVKALPASKKRKKKGRVRKDPPIQDSTV